MEAKPKTSRTPYHFKSKPHALLQFKEPAKFAAQLNLEQQVSMAQTNQLVKLLALM